MKYYRVMRILIYEVYKIMRCIRFSDPSNSNVASLKITKSLEHRVATAYHQFQARQMDEYIHEKISEEETLVALNEKVIKVEGENSLMKKEYE